MASVEDDRRLLVGWSATLAGVGACPDDSLVDRIGSGLLERWHEPHRHYHGTSHLSAGLEALHELGAGPLEAIAWWFHDAVHHNNPPWDEQDSAQLARELLPALLAVEEVEEVARLVLLTINHDAGADDAPGQRICDADLSPIGSAWPDYQRSVGQLRRERADLPDAVWESVRINFTGRMLSRSSLFHTRTGRDRWQQQALANLTAERHALLSADPHPPHREETHR